MDLRGRVVVVTGAGGGIGGGLVRAVAPTDGTAILARPLDVTDEAATAALVADIASRHGPVDLWFANAGVGGGHGPETLDAIWDRQWRVNVMAHVIAARVLLPGWLARGEGHLVVTASMAGLLTTLGDGPYAATKHAAVGFAEWLAITYGARGVRVSCVCPGAVDTAMLRDAAGGDASRAAAGIGGGDVLTPDEAAARIVAGVAEDRFLILTHPEMHELVERKAGDPDRWIRGMQRLWAKTQELLRD
jgi:NAD(P)-dependent dehydrogenase (short-subunit alcohol dehydrogenase family)